MRQRFGRCGLTACVLSCVLAGRAFSADAGAAKGRAVADAAPASGATAELIAVLRGLETPSGDKRESINETWKRMEALIAAGADYRAAHAQGLNIWLPVFIVHSCHEQLLASGRLTHRERQERQALLRTPECNEALQISKIDERIAFLLDHGVDPNLDIRASPSRREPCDTVLRWAIRVGRQSSALLLLKHRASVEARCQDGDTPLHFAHDKALVCALIRAGAKVDAPNSRGQTPLLDAIGFDQWEAVRLLVDYGADPYRKDHEGRDGFHVNDSMTSRNGRAVLRRYLSRPATHSLCNDPPSD